MKVININHGQNEGIARKCKTLAEYSAFVDKVRKYEKEAGNLEEAIKKAIKFCREHDILLKFLEKNATEVINMLMTEWNWDDALTVRFKEGMEEGLEKAAKNALAADIPIEQIHEITGLEIEAIMKLQREATNPL